MGHPTEDERFGRAFEYARPRLDALLKQYGVAPDDGEDVLQEVLLALWRKRVQVRDYEAWLVTALRVECLRYRRRGKRQLHSSVDEPVLERLAGHDGLGETHLGLQEDLRKLIRRLPARHQALLQLRYGLGLTPEETAGRLGYQPSSLKKTTTRCLQALRRQLSRGPRVSVKDGSG